MTRVVGLLLYAYARGNRSSRGIERACWEDVAYKVIAGMHTPDHSRCSGWPCYQAGVQPRSDTLGAGPAFAVPTPRPPAVGAAGWRERP